MTYEEKEEVLWNTKDHVLHSNNVTMQLHWAADVMEWVDAVQTEATRELQGKPRPPTPKVEHELRFEAFNIVSYLAQQEHPEALFMKSKWLEQAKFGLRQDMREAYAGYLRASELGYGRGEYRMGMMNEQNNDIRKAIEHYNRGMAMKDSAATYRLGMMGLLGQHGQVKDFQYGLGLIQAAADTADDDAPQAAYVYGLLISRELPEINVPEGLLPMNLAMAKKYIEKAAYLGFAKAQLKMGQAYELCQLGCDFNPSYSLHYYGLAAKQGLADAALGVSRWFLFGYDGFFQKNEALAYKYGKQAADEKLPTGEFAMGYYYEIGIGVAKDIAEAKRWYQLAADHGNNDAIERLESLGKSKPLTKKDHETTTLGRIKSQHGSMRGKRPDRFNKPTTVLPSVQEDQNQPRRTPKVSPHVSPGVSPHTRPQDGGANMPDPSRLSTQDRPPAFSLNVSGGPRPASAAPYPEDDRPQPLNFNNKRPKSTAPYPDDDLGNSPRFDSNIRTSHGPRADRPMSAFGIRASSPHDQGSGGPPNLAVRTSQSMANLGPNNNHGRTASAGWDPQLPPSAGGYRKPSPGSNYNDGYGRPSSGFDGRQGGPPVQSPGQNRLQKQNPNSGNPRPHSAMPGQYPGVPGPRDTPQPQQFAPRTSSRVSQLPSQQSGRPNSENFDRPTQQQQQHGRIPSGGSDRPNRFDSLPHHPQPGGGSGHRPVQLQDNPGRIGSAPPMGLQQRPTAPTQSVHSSQSMPAKPSGQGPATFEEMNIPQGKNDSDCVRLDHPMHMICKLANSWCLGCHVNLLRMLARDLGTDGGDLVTFWKEVK